MFVGENNSNDPLNHEKRWENYLSYDMVPILKVSYLIVKKRFFLDSCRKKLPGGHAPPDSCAEPFLGFVKKYSLLDESLRLDESLKMSHTQRIDFES